MLESKGFCSESDIDFESLSLDISLDNESLGLLETLSLIELLSLDLLSLSNDY